MQPYLELCAKYLHIYHMFSIDQSTSNDWLKPVMTTGLVNMHIDRSIANLAFLMGISRLSLFFFKSLLEK